METLGNFLPYTQIILSVLLIASILLQRSDAGAGGAFGGGDAPSSSFYTKRGSEKILFNATIIIAILFALSAFATLLI